MKVKLDAEQRKAIFNQLNVQVEEMSNKDLMDTDGGIRAGDCYYPPDQLPWPRKPFPIPTKPPMMTTMAVGEEDGGIMATTLALGEEAF